MRQVRRVERAQQNRIVVNAECIHGGCARAPPHLIVDEFLHDTRSAAGGDVGIQCNLMLQQRAYKRRKRRVMPPCDTLGCSDELLVERKGIVYSTLVRTHGLMSLDAARTRAESRPAPNVQARR